MNITHHFDNILGRTGNWTGRVLIGCTNIPHKVDKKSYVTASFMQHFFRKICGLYKHQICDGNIWKLPSCIFHGVSLAVAKEFKIVVKNADLCGKKICDRHTLLKYAKNVAISENMRQSHKNDMPICRP